MRQVLKMFLEHYETKKKRIQFANNHSTVGSRQCKTSSSLKFQEQI